MVYTTYYIDSVNGVDTADGLSESTAKKTLAVANAIAGQVTAATPTKLLFKAGSEFSGTLGSYVIYLLSGEQSFALKL